MMGTIIDTWIHTRYVYIVYIIYQCYQHGWIKTYLRMINCSPDMWCMRMCMWCICMCMWCMCMCMCICGEFHWHCSSDEKAWSSICNAKCCNLARVWKKELFICVLVYLCISVFVFFVFVLDVYSSFPGNPYKCSNITHRLLCGWDQIGGGDEDLWRVSVHHEKTFCILLYKGLHFMFHDHLTFCMLAYLYMLKVYISYVYSL